MICLKYNITNRNHKRSFVGLIDWPKEVLEVVGLILQEVDLFCPLLVFRQLFIFYLFLKDFLPLLEFLWPFFKRLLPLFQLFYLYFQLRSALFRLELLPHRESNRTFVQSFVCFDGHIELILHPHEQDSSFWTVDCSLADNLVETLLVQLLSNRTDPGISNNLNILYLACLKTSFSSSSFCRVLTSSLDGGLVLIFLLKFLPSASQNSGGNMEFKRSKIGSNFTIDG